MIVGGLLEWILKHRATLYLVGQRVSAFMAQKNSFDNFLVPFFSLSFTLKGVLTLQNCKVVINLLIVSNLIYLFFNFIYWHLLLIFIFLSNLIFILLIPIYFAFNIFSDWILFFNFIRNYLILISLFLLNLILILIIAIPFILSSFID